MRLSLMLAAILVMAAGCNVDVTPSATSSATSAATPSATPSASAPEPVRGMIDWLQSRTMSCGQVSATRWTCQLDAAAGLASADDHTVTTVTMDMARSSIADVTATLDATRNPVPLASVLCTIRCDLTTGFFAETIASGPVTGKYGPAISSWVSAHGETGGAMSFGPIEVTLSPPGPKITMSMIWRAG